MRRLLKNLEEQYDKEQRAKEIEKERQEWIARNPRGFPIPRRQKPGEGLLPPLGKSNFVSPRNKGLSGMWWLNK